MTSEDNLKFSGKEIEYNLIKARESKIGKRHFLKQLRRDATLDHIQVEKSKIQKILKA